jgi:peptidoglycan/LPS O-acetylase OafA/YrhL
MLKKIKKFKILGAFFVLAICISIDARFDRVVTKLFFFECLIYFVTGILIFFVVEELNRKTTKLLKSMINLAAFLTLSVARYFDILLFDSGSNSWFWVLTYFVFLVSQIDGQIFTQKFKKLRIIGDLSYSVFLWHIPIQVFIKVVLHDSEIRDSYANSNLFFCFYLLLTYTSGFVSHKFFEQPAQRFLRLKFMRPSRIG